MPDIQMCPGHNPDKTPCPLRDKCYRYRATPNETWQSFGFGEYADGKCRLFYPIERGHRLAPLPKEKPDASN